MRRGVNGRESHLKNGVVAKPAAPMARTATMKVFSKARRRRDGMATSGRASPSTCRMEGPFSVQTGASSAVLDTPEFVRNVDIVTDILSQTEIFGAVQEGYGKIVDAINKAADLLK